MLNNNTKYVRECNTNYNKILATTSDRSSSIIKIKETIAKIEIQILIESVRKNKKIKAFDKNLKLFLINQYKKRQRQYDYH